MIKQFLIAFVMSSSVCFAQENEHLFGSFPEIDGPSDKKLIVLDSTAAFDENPSFPSGTEAMKAFISKNFRYPAYAAEQGISGKVYVTFVIDTNGSVTEVKVLRGISGDPDCDKEAMRLVKIMPDWIPGKRNGVPVKADKSAGHL